jgi:triacylglycerol esterase/lipase EstA (alpha/beta hydrolase family)
VSWVRLRALLVIAVSLLLVAPSVRADEPAPPPDPPYSVPESALAAALACPASFSHPDHEPVLLVHGTFTSGPEQWTWSYGLMLEQRGFDVCTVTYPDRGLGDMQVSAEYVAHAVNEIHDLTGSPVDMVGHSQGGIMPRWAIKWWPSVQANVDDFVMLASPNHGVALAAGAKDAPFQLSEVMRQFDPASAFVTTLNAGDETPGSVSYSSIYSLTDELVQPATPTATAAVDGATNVLVQDLCPGRVVDHLSLGTTDRLVQELTIDALVDAGPVDPARLDLDATCSIPDQMAEPAMLTIMVGQGPSSFGGGFPAWHPSSREPDIKPYARG